MVCVTQKKAELFLNFCFIKTENNFMKIVFCSVSESENNCVVITS